MITRTPTIEPSEREKPTKHQSLKLPSLRLHFPTLPTFLRFRKIHLPLKTKIGLGIACIALIVLAASIVFIKSNQEETKNQQIFQHYYPEAKSYFDSGNAVANVDTTSPNSLAEYQKADSLLQTAQKQLPPSSSQAKQIVNLLDQVEQIATCE